MEYPKRFLKVVHGVVSSIGEPISKIIFAYISEKILFLKNNKSLIIFIVLIIFLIYFVVKSYSTTNELEKIGIIGAIIFFVFLFCLLNKKPKF